MVVYHAGKAAEIKAGSRDLKLTWAESAEILRFAHDDEATSLSEHDCLTESDYLVG